MWGMGYAEVRRISSISDQQNRVPNGSDKLREREREEERIKQKPLKHCSDTTTQYDQRKIEQN